VSSHKSFMSMSLAKRAPCHRQKYILWYVFQRSSSCNFCSSNSSNCTKCQIRPFNKMTYCLPRIACARTMVVPWLLLVLEGLFVFALMVSFSCFGYVTSFAGCPLLLAGPWLEPPVHGTHGPNLGPWPKRRKGET
jgi:hypothetical protein